MKTYKYNSEKLTYEPTNQNIKVGIYKSTTIILLLLYVCNLVYGFVDKPKEPIKPKNVEKEVVLVTDSKDRFTKEKFKELLLDLNIKHPSLVYAQAIQETGNFKSSIFLENHNIFGMKTATVRATTNKGTNRGHAYYSSWQNSVLDYALYQSSYLRKMDRDQYINYISRNYSTDSSYVSRIKHIMNTNKNCQYLSSHK